MSEIEDLKLKHADIINNEAVKKIANWRQSNSDVPLDSTKYTEQAQKNLGKFLNLLQQSTQKK